MKICMNQVCHIFLGTTYQNGGGGIYQRTPKFTKWPWNIPDGRKMFPMAIKYNKKFHSNALQNIPKLVFLVWNYTIWQPWCEPQILSGKTWPTITYIYSAGKINVRRWTKKRFLWLNTSTTCLLLQWLFWNASNFNIVLQTNSINSK
jgi:hypothetical protein